MLKALLPALAFFGSVAYATSGTPSTRTSSTRTSSSFLDRIEPKAGDSSFSSFSKGVSKYAYEGLFGKGGSLSQASNTTIPRRISSPAVASVQPVKATATQFYVPGLSNERLMSKAQVAAGNPMINAIFGKAMQYNPRVGRNINLAKAGNLKNIKSRISPKQVYA
tara:strand:+ start:2210 stop:2704 length:495 start_codon:yes stop_codon:yes gene_type:complete